MNFLIDLKNRCICVKISFESFNDLKWLKENLWFELVKRWFPIKNGYIKGGINEKL